MIDPLLHLLCRAGIALLLVVAAAHKLRDPLRFEAALRGYALLPERVLPAVGRALIAIEASVAIGLLINDTHLAAAYGALALLTSYTGAIVWNLLRGRRDIDCGCLGPQRSRGLGWSLVARNSGLLVAAAVIVAPVGSRALGALDAVTFAGSLAVAALCSISFASLGALPSLAREARPVSVPTAGGAGTDARALVRSGAPRRPVRHEGER